MKRACLTVAAIVIVVIFATTLCAQSCIDVTAASSDCPEHHPTDCCKHGDVASDRLKAEALNRDSVHKSAVHLAFLPALTFEAAPPLLAATFNPFAAHSAHARSSSPATNPLPLRILSFSPLTKPVQLFVSWLIQAGI